MKFLQITHHIICSS